MVGVNRTLGEFFDPQPRLATQTQADRATTESTVDCHNRNRTSASLADEDRPENGFETTCSFCREQFTYDPVREPGNYCSYSCFVKACTRENLPFWVTTLVTKRCLVCGTPFETVPATEPDRDTCSSECLRALRSAHATDGDQLAWMGTEEYPSRYYGPKWTQIRDRVRADTCAMPGCSKTKTDRGTALHVHHIVPVSAFDDPDDAHFEENLITLCHTHHLLVEHYGMNATLDGYAP